MRRVESRWCAACVCAVLACAPAAAQSTVGDVYASDASVRGSVVLASGGTRVLSGSTVSAGLAPATMKLARGGTLRICPGTNLSVGASQSGRTLQMGFDTGAVELHYELEASADTLQTSDFKFLLAGPGKFDVAISADTLGNTCVRPQGPNTASLIVQELFGDSTYQVKPDEAIVFRKGRIADNSRDVPPDCGCPAVPEVKSAAEVPQAPASAPQKRGQEAKASPPGASGLVAPALSPPPADGGAAAPVSQAATQMEVEAPFVYRAESGVPDPPTIAFVHLADRTAALMLTPAVLPPPGAAAAPTAVPAPTASRAKPRTKKGFLGRLRSLFSSIFR